MNLSGLRVVVTRARGEQGSFVDALLSAGAVPVLFPTIEIGAVPGAPEWVAPALKRLGPGSVVLFTSKNAVAPFSLGASRWRRRDAVRVAAIGRETARALEEAEIRVDLVPAEQSAEALVAAVGPPTGSRFALYPCGSLARDVLSSGLEALSWHVERLVVYETLRPKLEPGALDALADADAVSFASPSAVTGFLDLAGRDRLPAVVASIGPHTSAALRANGIEVTCEATTQSSLGLIEALGHLGS